MRRNSAMLYTNWEKWAVETWARPRRPKAEEFLLRLLLLGPARLLYPTHIDWVIFFFFSWSPKRQANLTTTTVTNVNTRKNSDRWRHARLNPPTQPDGQSLFLLLLPILISVFWLFRLEFHDSGPRPRYFLIDSLDRVSDEVERKERKKIFFLDVWRLESSR